MSIAKKWQTSHRFVSILSSISTTAAIGKLEGRSETSWEELAKNKSVFKELSEKITDDKVELEEISERLQNSKIASIAEKETALRSAKDGFRNAISKQESKSNHKNSLISQKASFGSKQELLFRESEAARRYVKRKDLSQLLINRLKKRLEDEELFARVEIKMKIDDPDRIMPSDGKEDDRFKEEPTPELAPDDSDIKKLAIETEDPTGARFAFNTINNSNIEKLLSDTRKLLPRDEDKQEYKDYAMYNVDLWLLTYEKELSDELGKPPAFDKVVTNKPAGAQVQGAAADFAADELPELSAGEESLDDITADLENILMME